MAWHGRRALGRPHACSRPVAPAPAAWQWRLAQAAGYWLAAGSSAALVPPPVRRLCCLCGTSITPNPTNMCVNCIRTQVDITEGIQKQVTVLWCKSCGRYLQPPKHWLKADLGGWRAAPLLSRPARRWPRAARSLPASAALLSPAPSSLCLVLPTESKELLTYCIKRVRGLSKVKLVDAAFVWTEPHR